VLFSPATAKMFEDSNKDIYGTRITIKSHIVKSEIGLGDKLICYVTKIHRFLGILEIQSKMYEDNKPIFTKENDPFVLRFKVKPLVWLSFEKAIPIKNNIVWNKVSFLKDEGWKHIVRSSFKSVSEDDGTYLENVLFEQTKKQEYFPFDKKAKRSLTKNLRKEDIIDKTKITSKAPRLSIVIQANLAEIGEKLGLQIWLPESDRTRVLQHWQPKENVLLQDLPLGFDKDTLKTIRNIDVLWIKKHAIVRAFEVEDSTSIYSGLLRMSDLLTLQPNLNIKIHIVSPEERKYDFFKQINRPTFLRLSKICSYISYDSINELSEEKKLEFMNDLIIDNVSEYVEKMDFRLQEKRKQLIKKQRVINYELRCRAKYNVAKRSGEIVSSYEQWKRERGF